VAAPRADLIADFATVEIPRLTLSGAHVVLSFLRGAGGTDGAVAITADSQYGAARARTDFRFAAGGLDLTGLDADAGGIQAKGALALRSGQPSTADLVLAIGPGALLTEGSVTGTARIADASGGPRATLNLTARNAALRGARGLRFAAGHDQRQRPARAPAAGPSTGAGPMGSNPWRFKGSRLLRPARADHRPGARWGRALRQRRSSGRWRPHASASAAGQRFADLKLDIEGGKATITAANRRLTSRSLAREPRPASPLAP
jgi:translocation and assembly module TamB